MKRSRILLFAAAACLAWPAAAFADPPDKGAGAGDQSQTHHGKGDQKSGGGAAGAPSGKGGKGSTGGPGVGGPPNGVPVHAVTVAPTTPAAPVQTGQRRVRGFQGQTIVTTHQPPTQPALTGWDKSVRGTDRDQAGQQWRAGHKGWDANALWRQNADWWRHDASFRLFGGARLGFFFIPALGYVAVPAEYQQHYWRQGDMLPQWFWRFTVRDYARYGLPQPPDGCEWVWVDDDVALIDPSDGYILDIVHNIW
jgi:Ni/Co efflux regulator RcnB